jgi:hypothetical protein
VVFDLHDGNSSSQVKYEQYLDSQY